jgi:hypothetical protein
MILAAATLLVWGAAGWLRPLGDESASVAQTASSQVAAPTTVPAEHVQPASYAPEDGWF